MERMIDKARKRNQAAFLKKYARFHVEWTKRLVSAYKQRGIFPLFPTFIANYYEDEKDKELAVIASICLNWKREILPQIKALREIMGDHPYEWFTSRGFIHLSTGEMQNKKMLSNNGGRNNWKVARFFDMLYDHCNGKSFRSVFRPGRTSQSKSGLVAFAEEAGERIKTPSCRYNAEVVELILRASDGFSLGLWPTDPSKIKSPCNGVLKKFMTIWFPDYYPSLWDYSEAVALFGLDNDYDFFYFYYAWEDLKKSDKDGCVKYSTRYVSRYKGGYLMGPVFWTGKRGVMPDIKFRD